MLASILQASPNLSTRNQLFPFLLPSRTMTLFYTRRTLQYCNVTIIDSLVFEEWIYFYK